MAVAGRTLAAVALLALLAAIPAGAAAPGAPGATNPSNRAERLRIPFPRDDGTLTPYTFELAYPLVTLIYDTLTERDRRDAGLARTITRSDAGRLVTVKLHDGIRWHDGRPLTAADVAFTFTFVKEHFHPRFTPQLEAVVRARAVDRLTVAITLRHPSPGFNVLPLSDLPILPEHLWRGLAPGRRAPAGLPVGSGPYRLVEHRRGKRYRFRANHGYFLGRPRVERIDVPFMRSFDKTVRALQNRRIDMIPVTLPQRTQEDLRTTSFKVKTGDLYSGSVLMFNLRKAPFDDVAVRQAVAAALDIPRIARAELIGHRDAEPANRGYLHPASRWAAVAPLYRFAPARARRELAKLALPPIRVLAADNDPVRLEAGRQVVLALERVGARASLRRTSARRLADAVGQDGSPPTFEAAIWSSPALASYDPDFLRVVFGSGRAPLNYSGYRSSAFDALARRTAAATNRDTRRQSVRSQLRMLAHDVPVVPLFFAKGAFVYRPQIYDGWLYAKGAGILDKRSFLPRVVSPAVARPRTPAATAPSSEDGGLGPSAYVALGLLGLVAVVILSGYVARLRNR